MNRYLKAAVPLLMLGCFALGHRSSRSFTAPPSPRTDAVQEVEVIIPQPPNFRRVVLAPADGPPGERWGVTVRYHDRPALEFLGTPE